MLRLFNQRSVLLALVIAIVLVPSQVAHAQGGGEDPNLLATPVEAGSGVEGAPEDPGPIVGGAGGLDIRIDLSTFQSIVPGNWNNIAALTGMTPNLIDFNSGAGTGVSIDGTGSPWSDFFGDDGGTFPDQAWLIQPATVDGAGLGTGAAGTFVIAGLPSGTYQVEVVSARTTFGYLNTITVDGALADRTFLGTPVVTPWNSTDDGLTPGNWLIWDAVVPVGGVITITDQADAATLGILNAVRILEAGGGATTLPIPTLSVWGIIVLGLALALAAAVLLRRRFAYE